MKIMDIFERGVCQICHGADDLPIIRMAFGVKELADHIASVAVGAVVRCLAFFIFNHTLLIGKSFLCQSRSQKTQTVGFQPQRHFQGVFRQNFKVDGPVVAGPSIQSAARFLNFFEKLVLAHMLGFLEHHVLKEMGESRVTGGLAVGSHMVLKGYGAYRIGVIGMKDNLQAVIESVFLISDFQFPLRSAFWRASGENQNKHQKKQKGRIQMTFHSNLLFPEAFIKICDAFYFPSQLINTPGCLEIFIKIDLALIIVIVKKRILYVKMGDSISDPMKSVMAPKS